MLSALMLTWGRRPAKPSRHKAPGSRAGCEDASCALAVSSARPPTHSGRAAIQRWSRPSSCWWRSRRAKARTRGPISWCSSPTTWAGDSPVSTAAPKWPRPTSIASPRRGQAHAVLCPTSVLGHASGPAYRALSLEERYGNPHFGPRRQRHAPRRADDRRGIARRRLRALDGRQVAPGAMARRASAATAGIRPSLRLLFGAGRFLHTPSARDLGLASERSSGGRERLCDVSPGRRCGATD